MVAKYPENWNKCSKNSILIFGFQAAENMHTGKGEKVL
jgi:hypothetical protein